MHSQHLHTLLAILQNSGKTEEAIRVASKLLIIHPEYVYFKLVKNLTLPIIYECKEEIDLYRNQFIQGLNSIIQEISLATPEAIKNALLGIGCCTNFYLAYQGYNDLELQKKYGQFVHQIMGAKYPQWVQPLPMPPLSQDGKIRVGYVSAAMRMCAGAKCALSWIKHYNKHNFEIYCYFIGSEPDLITEQFRLNSNVFHHIPDDLEAVCQQIVNDQLHILVFTDIGMRSKMTQMAGLRLAPVQCSTMGHPLTSGLPTIQYYISNVLMEPDNAELHYSEQLIRLPNLGICYAKPTIPEPSKNRVNFQLRDDAVVYFSCQSLFKYLPQYDYIFAAIASQVPQSQFVFISHHSTYVTEKFQLRLQKAFASVSLNSEHYCVILPKQDWSDYCNLNLVSDIFLDTFSWSGHNTTLEAIACNLPVVTCPGEFMRGRHSYGILKMLGVTETIAKNADEYIKIAVRLGLDREWRSALVEKIKNRHTYVYDDKTCVASLESFYQSLVQSE